MISMGRCLRPIESWITCRDLNDVSCGITAGLDSGGKPFGLGLVEQLNNKNKGFL